MDMEFMEMYGFCRDGIGGEKKTIRDGVFNEQTGKIEDQVIISGSTLEYMRDNRVWARLRVSYSLLRWTRKRMRQQWTLRRWWRKKKKDGRRREQ